jgi:DNA-binding NarL/FixJ family response regulator
MPRILIVDDHEIVRRGVRGILEKQDSWEVIGEASNALDAIRLYDALKPDAVVMDITMPGMNGIDATRKITSVQPAAKVLIFTMHENNHLLQESEQAGAKGLLIKSRAAQELTPALQKIIGGETYFH